MKPTKIITTLLIAGYCILGSPQQGRAQTIVPDRYPMPQSARVETAIEGALLTYGASLGFPVIWVEQRVKIIPQVGIIWRDIPENEWIPYASVGAQFLYHFRKQPAAYLHRNSFYAGFGFMTSALFDLIASGETRRSRTGIIIGYNYHFNEAIKLAPEFHFGFDQNGNAYGAVGVAFHFGW